MSSFIQDEISLTVSDVACSQLILRCGAAICFQTPEAAYQSAEDERWEIDRLNAYINRQLKTFVWSVFHGNKATVEEFLLPALKAYPRKVLVFPEPKIDSPAPQ